MLDPQQAALCSVVLEFLEVAVHTVLFTRGIYHKDAFERVRAFNTYCRRSRHPELNSYISSTISRLRPLIESGHLRELAVLVFDSRSSVVERVSFCTQLLASSTLDQAQQAQGAVDVDALEAGLGSALLKLQFIDSLLKPLPQGCTFELAAYSTSRSGVDAQYFGEESSGALELRQPVTGTPLKTVCVPGCINMQVLVEEAARG
ncbi:hypothetical protein CHLRE_13g575333v5 [Chlamydomonas reinhardtii]|uniref:HORMA domain-containing protein n=1 Tax=Chlamydomonas reinhardtii TaxID=3055 RepID=A0A2K3CZY6_CHLRE|nr:uncharacterized protein CHLRE_13g575333v5 [Chlamydomonas reinhardtii]PNW73850.1 hypothetical protein CHLRE_13g575333v5 [Chlamydomonas reinhardtii]